jgi:hypothetical protein
MTLPEWVIWVTIMVVVGLVAWVLFSYVQVLSPYRQTIDGKALVATLR